MVAIRSDDVDAVLASAEVSELAEAVEAGVLARAALDTADFRLGTAAELELVGAAGERARHCLIRANLGLVRMVARSAAKRSGQVEADLYQEGCLGLIAAVERFDHRRGHRFSTYAVHWIRAYVSAATARATGGMNLPASRAAQLRVARGVEGELAQRLGRPPSGAEVANALGRTEAWTTALLAHQAPQSLDALDSAGLDAFIAPDQLEAVLDRHLDLVGLLDRLTALPRRVIELRTGWPDGQPYSFAQVARELGISTSQARRLESRALEVLRSFCPQQASALLNQ